MAFKEHILLGKWESPDLEKLLEIYRKDKFKARVVFYNNHIRNKINVMRCVAFINDDDTFEIGYFTRIWGISKTNKLYNRERKNFSIFKSKKGFYFVKNKNCKPLTLGIIKTLPFEKEVIAFIMPHFPPLELMVKYNLLVNKSFNYILKHKLTSLKKMLQYTYNAPYPIAKKFHENFGSKHVLLYHLNLNADWIKNIENFNMELVKFDCHTLIDTIIMAKTLDRKVNLAWSRKRLLKEHNDMSEIITDIVYSELDEPLKIKKVYEEFAKITGYRLLKTTKELAIEGQKQSNCVAGYCALVNSGFSAILHVEGYTLEIGENLNGLKIKQFRGYANKIAPPDLYQKVQNQIDAFNMLKITVNEMENAETEENKNSNIVNIGGLDTIF